jgi:class 3 adenylate cyclase/tetratricopeptide (TPR) repeat protein
VQEVPAEEVRRTVSIVFSDLKGSTSLGERLDSERLRSVLNTYFNEMRAVLERHGGTVEKYIGDAIMAVFGLPRVREDDAVRAVRAAFEMKQTLVEVNKRLEATFGVRLENRTGVYTGEVVAGDVSSGQRLVTGDTVNTAARLEQNAPTGEILIGEPTYRLVRDAVTVEPVEPLELKGKADHVAAYRLLGVSPTEEGYARRLDLPIVGREAELERLSAAIDRVIDGGRCRLVTVFGPAGVGKSRLLGELVRRESARATALRGRCPSYGEGITYWPIGEVVRGAAGIDEDDGAEQALAKLSALLGGHQDVTERLGAAIGLVDEVYPLEETSWAIRRALELVATDRPLIVLVDDIHWAEPTLLDLLRYLVEGCAARVLVVCSSRRELLEEHPEWGDATGGFDVIALEPLVAEESALVVRNLLGGSHVDPAVVERITAAAEGNPLYVEQMILMMIDDGSLRDERGGWVVASSLHELEVPPTVAALLTARLDRLGPVERSVIDRAAVIGQVFLREAVEALVPERVTPEVGGCLATLAAKELIAPDVEQPAEGEGFRFLHALIRDAAYRGLLKRTRAELHEAFVDWVENDPRHRSLEYEEIRGYHLEQAYSILHQLGVQDDHVASLGRRAAGYLGGAGRRNLARGDLPAAERLLRRAAETLPDDDPEAVELLIEAGEALIDLGELTIANEVLDDAIRRAGAAGSRPLEVSANLVHLRLHYETAGADPAGTLREDARAAERELEIAGDHLGLIRAHHLLLLVDWTAGRYGPAEREARALVEHARAIGDRTREVRFLPALATCAVYGPTPADEGAARCRELLDEVAADHKAVALVSASLARLEAFRGNFDQARVLYTRSRALLQEFGWNLLAACTSIDSGPIELLASDPVAAERELRRDFETLEAMGERNYIATIAAYLAFALLLQDRDDEADRFARFSEETAAEEDLTSQFLWRQFRARLLSRAGDHDAAVATAQRAVELTDRTQEPESQGNARLDLATVLAAAGRPNEAASVYTEALDRFRSKGIVVLVEEVGRRRVALGVG